jgi:mono/diheme cytochrome c family protein
MTMLALFTSLLYTTAHADTHVDGALVYSTNCASCHQASGEGLPGVFPPLAGHASELYQQEGGRRYLSDVVVFGLQGPISVGGASYDGVMPSWFHLSDDEIAAVLNHVLTAWDDEITEFEPYTAADVATSRRGARTPQGVWERRPSIQGEAASESADLTVASFTMAQVERARPIYDRLCNECHGSDFTGGLIGGPPLRGPAFLQRWGGRSVEALFTFTRTQMPQGGPNTLPAQQYADLVAMILSANGHDPGDVELVGDPDALRGLGIRDP